MAGGNMALIEHLEKLRHFIRVTQYKSINEAALDTGMSQAGLSKSIASLEEVLGASLLLRSNQGLVLTKEGELTLATAKKILAESTALEINLRSLKTAKSPEKLRIGMYDSIAIYFFNDLISYLKEIYKKIEIELLVDTSSNLVQAVKMNEVDLCIGVNLSLNQPPKTEFFLLFEDHYAFYKSAKAEITSSAQLILHPNAKDLEGNTNEKQLCSVIKKNGGHRVFNFETLKTLTVQGVGIGVLPTQVARPLVSQRQLIQVEVPRTKSAFGKHNIGFLAAEKFLLHHREFANDIYRLGEKWSKI